MLCLPDQLEAWCSPGSHGFWKVEQNWRFLKIWLPRYRSSDGHTTDSAGCFLETWRPRFDGRTS